MQPYGNYKRGPKIHPHNECGICNEKNISKGKERLKVKRDLEKEFEEYNITRKLPFTIRDGSGGFITLNDKKIEGNDMTLDEIEKCLVAYTPVKYEGYYPPYINVTKKEDNIIITVRSPVKENGDSGETGIISIKENIFCELMKDLTLNLMSYYKG